MHIFYCHRIFCFIAFIILCFTNAFAQSVEIKGFVKDAESKKKLQYASIKIKNTSVGTYSGNDGSFLLRIPAKYSTDTLEISYVGYNTTEYLLNNVKQSGFTVFLTKKSIKLNEVVVKPFETELIKRAFENSVHTSPDFDFLLHAYFSEKITENDSAIQKIECIFSVFRNSIVQKPKDRIKIVQKQNSVEKRYSIIWDYLYFINAPYEMLYADFVRYPQTFIQVPVVKYNFLNQKYFSQYSYKRIDNKSDTVYKIQFSPLSQTSKSVYSGEFHVHKKDLAFTYLNYSYCKSKLKMIHRNPSSTQINLARIKVYHSDDNYMCEMKYKKTNEKWIIDEVNQKWSFRFCENPSSDTLLIEITDFFKVYKVETENIKPFEFWETITPNINLDKFYVKPDENFRKNFNYEILKN